VVSSIDAAAQPSSVEPPSHQPTNAAMLLKFQQAVDIIARTNVQVIMQSKYENTHNAK
jgi:hypothetical protein